jgi:RNA polymerase sigma-70 factor (ECF subfamily)
LASGDVAAFAELYDACAGRVHRYLVARLGSRSDAEDVLQEVFVRLARARKRLGGVANLGAYVLAVARNEAARLAARRARDACSETILADEVVLCEAAADDRGARETAEWVRAALGRLEPALREIVELKIYAGLTFQEISEVTGLPQGTAATRYRKALEKMRSQLARQRS